MGANINRRRLTAKGVLALLCVAGAGAVMARNAVANVYPERPIKLIVPFAPGGSTDIVARLVAQAMHAPLGQTVVVENKAGAGGMLGSEAVAKADPDGYTMGLGSISTLAVNPVVLPQLRFDPVKDLRPVLPLASIASVFSVRADTGVQNFAGFMQAAKAHADQWAVGSSGVGSVGHLILAALNRDLGLQLRHIPYKGQGPVVQSALSGETQMLSDQYPSSAPHIQSGLLTPFAVAAQQRLAGLPTVPTLAELGYPELNSLAITWFGLVVPAGTPTPIVKRLNAAANAALQQPALRSRLAQLGVQVLGGTPEQLQQSIEQTSKVVDQLVRQQRVLQSAP